MVKPWDDDYKLSYHKVRNTNLRRIGGIAWVAGALKGNAVG